MKPFEHRTSSSRARAIVLSTLAGALLFAALPLAASATDWPQAHTDLRADPSVVFGTLPNGMRYAIMHNATPKGAVAMQFCIDAGSLQESDAQQGLAHFLEHMAFRGSHNVPEDQVWSGLQRLGLGIGADANASTDWTQTIYKFNFPRNDAVSIDTGLLRMRDIASELTLAQRAMDDERGPILSEERLRDTPQLHAIKEFVGQGLPGHRLLSRMPIGLTEVIKNAPVSLIRDFYQAYYRPERAVLIVVGDIDPKAIEDKIVARFADWHGMGPAGSDPPAMPPGPRAPDAKLFLDARLPASLNLAWVAPIAPDTKAREQADLIEMLGLTILKYRLENLANGPQHPFAQVQLQIEPTVRDAIFRFFALDIRPQDWRLALNAAITETRRIVQYGVTPDEVTRAINNIRADAQAQAARASTRTNNNVATALAKSVDRREVFESPADLLALVNERFQHLTADEVNASLRGMMANRGPLVFLTEPSPIEGGQEALSAALAAALKAPLTQATAEAPVVWPYTSFGIPGEVADRKTIDDLQTTFVRFANGVKLTLKPTSFTTGDILINVRLGNGRVGLPADRMSPIWAFNDKGLVYGGLKALGLDDLQRALAGRLFQVGTNVEEEGLFLFGHTRPADLATQLQVLTAYISAPGWRPEGIDRARQAEVTKLANASGTPSGVVQRDIQALLRDGDRRWAAPSLAEINATTLDELRDMVDRQIGSAPIEVTVVGDISLDDAITAVAATFGALPQRSGVSPTPPTNMTLRFPAGTPTPVELYHHGRSDQGVAVIAWPASNSYDLPARQDLRVIEQVVATRMLDQLRVHDGATYSPQTILAPSRTFPGYGYFAALTELPPAKMPLFFSVAAAIAADLRANPISDDELERARRPALESLIALQQSNTYWSVALVGVQSDPHRLDIIRDTIPDLKLVTPASVQRTAQKYLTDSNAWKAMVVPEAPPAR